jgi:tetratricopeptide (TPR) repeat protein
MDAQEFFNRGIASYQNGDNNSAIADLTEAAKLDPNDAQIYGARGTIKNMIGDFDGVINDFTEVIRLAPTFAAYAIRGGAYHEKGKEALHAGDNNGFFKYKNLHIKDCEAALRINPADQNMQKMLELATDELKLRKGVTEYIGKVGEIFGS